MSDQEITAIAEGDRIIVSGYVFTKREDGLIRILNLRHVFCSLFPLTFS